MDERLTEYGGGKEGGANMLLWVGTVGSGAEVVLGARKAAGEDTKILAGGARAVKGDGDSDSEADALADADANSPPPEGERIRVRGLRGARTPSGTVSRGSDGARGGVESVEEGRSPSLEE
jgi:hypothetical protein